MLLSKNQLSSATDKELKQAEAAIAAEVARRANSVTEKVKKELSKVAAGAGMSLDELLSKLKPEAAPKAPRGPRKAAAKVKSKGKVAPKYRNPDDATQTWTGRGRQPVWVAKAIADGKTLESLLIAA